MDAFTVLNGRAAPLDMINVDTDIIIPKQFLKTVKRTGLGVSCFYNIRYDDAGEPLADFSLNQEQHKNAEILVTGENFGCGSSREHAPWALLDMGFKCIIAPSFATIFRNNALRNGLLTVALEQHDLDELVDWVTVDPAAHTIQLDLEACSIEFDPERDKKVFSVDPTARDMLLKGLDEIGLTEQSMDLVARFEEQDQARRPWVYLPSD